MMAAAKAMASRRKITSAAMIPTVACLAGKDRIVLALAIPASAEVSRTTAPTLALSTAVTGAAVRAMVIQIDSVALSCFRLRQR
jgi:hypothetical protein